VRRQLLFIRPNTVVIADRVSATNPNFPKLWQCFLAGSATSSEKGFATDNGKARLKGEVLFPEDAKLALLTGQDKAISVWGTKVPQDGAGAKGVDDGPAFKIEVKPGTARDTDFFLVVMRVNGSGDSKAVLEGNQYKLTIPGAPEIVLNADGTAGGSVGGKALANTIVLPEE
jgi:hypothetical protein